MSTIECVGCGTELNPDTVEYCPECTTPVEYSLENQNEEEPATAAGEPEREDDDNSGDSSTPPSGGSTEGAETSTESTVQCPVCNSAQDPAQNFCRECGAELDSGSSPTKEPPDDPQSDAADIEMWLELGGHSVQLSDGDTIGAGLREIVMDMHSREEALYISREQFEVSIDAAAGRCLLRDLGSKNGTILNGEELPTEKYQQVVDGDSIVLPPDIQATIHIESDTATHTEEETGRPTNSVGDVPAESTSASVELYGDPDQVVYEVRDGQSIGRGDKADVTMDVQGTVSRIHATFERTENGWTLIDQSSNGSFVRSGQSQDWSRIDDQMNIEDGEQLGFGKIDELAKFNISID